VLPFELDGRQHHVLRVFALRIIEHLDVFEYVLPGGVPCGVGLPSDPFAFEELEKAFGDSVVMAVAATAHAGFKIVLTQKRLPLTAGELTALIGMDHHLVLRLRTAS
jgi:hypothetical protein